MSNHEFADPVVLEDHEEGSPIVVRRRSIEQVILKDDVYEITAYGLSKQKERECAERKGDYSFLPPDEDQVDVCITWLQENVEPSKRLYKKESYALKHVIEGHGYVTNGALVLAAHRLNYRLSSAGGYDTAFFFKLKEREHGETEDEAARRYVKERLQQLKEKYRTEDEARRIEKVRKRLERPAEKPTKTKPIRIPTKREVRRAIRKSIGREGISLTLRFFIFKRDKYRCQICGRTADDGLTLEIDHKIPVSRGGSDDVTNLHILCFECNRGKGVHSL